tara:strand:+ start:291 stop:467 length:177 start_codon:yes stop_codon:yes gene_type:complete
MSCKNFDDNKTRWAVHGDMLKIWYNGKLVGEVDQNEFAHLILQLAKSLKECDSQFHDQ